MEEPKDVPKLKGSGSSIKTRLGLGLIVLGFISPLFSFIIPLFGFPETLSALLIGFFLVGGPEIFMLLGAMLAGKEGVELMKGRVKRLFGLPEHRFPATKVQYNLALFLLLLWLLAGIIPGYWPQLFDILWIKENLLWISIGADLMFIASIFFLGGHQMIHKISRLFSWEPWELPQKEK